MNRAGLGLLVRTLLLLLLILGVASTGRGRWILGNVSKWKCNV